MRMTEVITKLREVNPAVQEEMGRLVLACNKAKDLTLDADRCATDEGRKSLVGALVVAVMQTKILCDSVASKLLELDAVTRSYTRKFESSGASALKLKEDPNQPCLPGLEPGGTLAPEDPELTTAAAQCGATAPGGEFVKSPGPGDWATQGEASGL